MRRLLLVLGLTLVAIAMFHAPNPVASQEKRTEVAEKPTMNEAVAKLLKVQLQAAQKPYRAALEKMQVKRIGGLLVLVNDNHPDPEEAYLWSVRWLHAQRDPSATKDDRITSFADHHQRMKDLRQQVTTLISNTGVLLPFSAAGAADWYVAESELWLAQERSQ